VLVKHGLLVKVVIVRLEASVNLASLELTGNIGQVFLPKWPPVALPCDAFRARLWYVKFLHVVETRSGLWDFNMLVSRSIFIG
jgi:hypothetical protein